MEKLFIVTVAVLAVLRGFGVEGQGCDSIQNVGIADCILQSVYKPDLNGVLIQGNGSTVVFDRMEHMSNIMKCLQGKSAHLTPGPPGRKRRAIDDAEPKVLLRLKHTLCYSECHFEYGSMAAAAPSCEIVDWFHLTLCVLYCLDDMTAYRSYRPTPDPYEYSPVNSDEFMTMKNDFTIDYVQCILNEISPGAACDSANYLSMSICKLEAILNIKSNSLAVGRRKRQAGVLPKVTDDAKLYDRILDTDCSMNCMLDYDLRPRECWMETMGRYALCINKCVRAVTSTVQRLTIWSGP